MNKPTIESDNTKVQRLGNVMDTLLQQKPVNLYSPIIIIAPIGLHRQWHYAVNMVHAAFQFKGTRMKRAITIMDLGEFEKRCEQKFEEQNVFVVDESYPNRMDLYARLLKALRQLNLDDGHRLFMTSAV